MIITTDEKWRVDPRVQVRLQFHTHNCSSRGAVRGADGRRAHTWGGDAEGRTQMSPKQAECVALEGGLPDSWGLSPSRTPRPSPPGAQQQGSCGGGVRNQKLPPPIGCQGQGRLSEAPPSVQGGGADKGSGTALPARGGGWGSLTPRPVVGAGGSPPIPMCLHRPGFTPVPRREGSTLSHRNLERRSAGRTRHSAQHWSLS